MLISDTNPLTVYGFSECYLRVSASPLSLAAASLRDRKMHLCNYSVQSLSSNDGGDGGDGDGAADCDQMMSQSDFDCYLRGLGDGERSYLRDIYPRIKEISCQAVYSVIDRIDRVGKGFEWLGKKYESIEEIMLIVYFCVHCLKDLISWSRKS